MLEQLEDRTLLSFRAGFSVDVGNTPLGVVRGDFNGDGKLDLVVANQSDDTVSILLNNGSGTLQRAADYSVVPAGGSSPFGPLGVVAADFNGDNKLDVATANQFTANANGLLGSVSVLLGTGTGTFASAVNYSTNQDTANPGQGPQALVAGDFNGDTKLDLIVACSDSNRLILLAGTGNGTFFEPTTPTAHAWTPGGYPVALASADFNGDNKPDLVVANNTTDSVSVLINTGSSFSAAANYGAGTSPTGVAAADFNNDTKPDVAVANSDSDDVTILFNNGTGTLSGAVNYAAGNQPAAVATADFNGDSKPDLVVVNAGTDNTVCLLLNSGTGTFSAPISSVVGDGPAAVATGDFNADGKSDAVVANRSGNTINVLLGNGNGSLSVAPALSLTGSSSAVLGADFNNDNKPDLVVADATNNQIGLLLGTGAGSFQSAAAYPVGAQPSGLAAGDFNSDGKLDLAVANKASSTVSVLLGNNGTFLAAVNYAAGTGPAALVARDFNGDGKLDLAVANFTSNNVSLLLGSGTGTFSAPINFSTGTGSASLAAGDFNGDSKLDLAVVNQTSSRLSILLGTGTGSFTSSSTISLAAGSGPGWVAVMDGNGDGKLDLAVANTVAGNVSVLLGNGNGTFASAVTYDTGPGATAVVAGDFNGDRKVDLAVANRDSTSSTNSGTISILIGDGSGTFPARIDYLAGAAPLVLAAADFNGGGDTDLAVANSAGNSLSVLLNDVGLTGSINPTVFGQACTFTATATPSSGQVPTGTVTFKDGTSAVGTGLLDGNGRATLTTSSLSSAGSPHTMTAAYAGDANTIGGTSAALVQAVTTLPLQVVSFTPGNTGFVAAFGRAVKVGTLNSPVLNLYDNSTASLRPADVTLTGAAGPIRGSLVIDQGNTRITFIQTGQTGVGVAVNKGVLSNGIYTVALRSASDGFQDTTGTLLDGNADGTPGDDYVTTFVINNPATSIAVTLPDFARGPGQEVNLPGNQPGSGMPLRLRNNASTAVTVTSVTLNLVYNASLLTITGAALADGLPGGSSFTLNTATAGLAIVTFNTAAGLVLSGSGINSGHDFLKLTARVPSTASYASKEILDLKSIQINGGSITALDDDAIHVSAFLGDVTRDLVYTGLDAQRISRVSIGADPGFRQWLLADPLVVGDVSGDNQLTGLDALRVSQQSVGIPQPTLPSWPAVTPTIVGPDPVLSIGTWSAERGAQGVEDGTPALPGASLLVPVNLDHADGLAAVDLAISYDTSRLEVLSAADIQRGSLTGDFDSFAVNLDKEAGIIHISGYRTAGPLVESAEREAQSVEGEAPALGNPAPPRSAPSGGTLATIGFHIKQDAPPGSAIINLLQNAGNTWSLPGGSDAQGNDFFFDLQPRVSNVAGDVLDGRINVLPLTVSSAVPAALPDELPVRRTDFQSVPADTDGLKIRPTQYSPVATTQLPTSQTIDDVPLSAIAIAALLSRQSDKEIRPQEDTNQPPVPVSLSPCLLVSLSPDFSVLEYPNSLSVIGNRIPDSLGEALMPLWQVLGTPTPVPQQADRSRVDDFFSRYGEEADLGSLDPTLLEQDVANYLSHPAFAFLFSHCHTPP